MHFRRTIEGRTQNISPLYMAGFVDQVPIEKHAGKREREEDGHQYPMRGYEPVSVSPDVFFLPFVLHSFASILTSWGMYLGQIVMTHVTYRKCLVMIARRGVAPATIREVYQDVAMGAVACCAIPRAVRSGGKPISLIGMAGGTRFVTRLYGWLGRRF